MTTRRQDHLQRRLAAELEQLQASLEAMSRNDRIREGCPKGWRDVERENPTRPRKVGVTLRIDKDVAKWFWQQGEGYQARMNAVLRAYMLAKAAKMT